MWEYATIAGLVFITWYDNLWLKKFEKFVLKNGFWVYWQMARLQTKWHYADIRAEMIKDGYHIDAVYLYVHGTDFIKQYDMLRVFREKVVQPEEKPLIRIDSAVDVMDFVKSCCDPDTNFNCVDPTLTHVLEVNYTFDHKKYRVYYDNRHNTKIRFPIYSDQAIRDRDILAGGVNAGLISESENESDAENGIDVTKELKRLAGPMQNFYDDTEYIVKKDLFMGERYPKNSFIHLIDGKGDSYVIRPEESLLSFTKNRESP